MILLIQQFSVNTYGIYLPGNELAASLKRVLRSTFEPAAAGNLHANDSHAADIVRFEDCLQLLSIVALVELGTSDQRNAVADDFLWKSA